MDIRAVFARNLRKARQAKGLSQEALAHDADIDRTYVSALERGAYGATIDMVDKLARVLELEASDLLERSSKSYVRKSDEEASREAVKPAKRKSGKS
jgi:transcriptional regulator with XRE-family HTH domain